MINFSKKFISALGDAKNVVAFTGAGISAESGISTFRGDDGIWKKMKPEELASFDAFIRNTEIVWEWYKQRKHIMKTAHPNQGHLALAEMQIHFRNVSVVTQNIDNLHRRAGSNTVYELHGNLERNYCIGCGKFYTDEEILSQERSPRCSSCQGLVRPDVVWFGENLPLDEWNASVQAAEMADIFFSIGTSGVVYPAASLPVTAKRAGAYLVEINVEETELSRFADEVIPGKSGEVLPNIIQTYLSIKQDLIQS